MGALHGHGGMSTVRKTKEFWTPQERLFAGEGKGRSSGRLPGGHVTDMADRKDPIMLCQYCDPKFASAKAGFFIRHNLPLVRGNCDGCSQYAINMRLYIHQSTTGR